MIESLFAHISGFAVVIVRCQDRTTQHRGKRCVRGAGLTWHMLMFSKRSSKPETTTECRVNGGIRTLLVPAHFEKYILYYTAIQDLVSGCRLLG